MEQGAQQDSGGNQYMSRRERRELLRSQKGGGVVGGSGRFLRRVLMWGGFIAVIALLGWGMVELSKNTPVPTADGTLSVPVGDGDISLGPVDAAVTLVEYSDFQCPACAAFSSIVKKALEEPELKGKIRFVYRYFPLSNIHPNAQIAGQAAHAASLQGKFWEMHDVLFEKQAIWSPLSNTAARNAFAEYAVQIGLDKDRFVSDMNSGAAKDRVKLDAASGQTSGVSSTPSFFLNGVRMTHPQSYDDFKQKLLVPLNATP